MKFVNEIMDFLIFYWLFEFW